MEDTWYFTVEGLEDTYHFAVEGWRPHRNMA
jgi:hypothetical protein